MPIGKAILLALHIISAGAWISQFIAEFAMERFARKMSGKPGAQLLGMAEGQVASLLGQIGGIGILLTGLGLIGVDGYALFGIGGYTPTWLIIKQVVYVVAMAIVGGVVIRGTRGLEAAAAAGQPVEIPSRVIMASRLVNVLVLVNIFLAVWKPQ
ncbi:MAG: hypothetical protein ABI835_13590 [Chloroflexota bacterium]